jgi:hypothetical protein
LRVAHDPRVDRFVIVHLGSRVKFIVLIEGDNLAPSAEVQCRRMDCAGGMEKKTIARSRFGDTGVVSASTVPALVDETIDQAPGAWRIVAVILWNALQSQV